MTSILLIIVSCMLIIMNYLYLTEHKHNKQLDKETELKNKELKNKNKELYDINYDLQTKNNILIKRKEELECDKAALAASKDRLSYEIDNLNNIHNKIKNNQESQRKELEKMSQKAYENFCDILDRKYEEKTKDYNNLVLNLDKSYATQQEKILKDINKLQEVLDNIKSTRTAAIEAQLREKEIKADMSFYCLIPSKKDLQDYDKINTLRPMLNNDRALSMLLWQTYYQPLAKKQFPQILGTSSIVIGIYKITNQITNQCYIGQSNNIDTRWKDHCKAGLGIDTPAGNKLYKAIQEYGLQNFSFEVLEKCNREQLDEKEKYYIDLYDAYNFGYNSTKGNK